MRRIQDDLDQGLPTINIVPMIDVVFAILTFFVMSTLFLTRSEGLPVNLPVAQNADSLQKPLRITLTLDAQGQVFLDRQPISLGDLTSALARRQRSEMTAANALNTSNTSSTSNTSKIIVILHADGKLPHEQVVEVLDRVKAVPGLKVAIATKKK
jgi:biopolymer transport protein ExbD